MKQRFIKLVLAPLLLGVYSCSSGFYDEVFSPSDSQKVFEGRYVDTHYLKTKTSTSEGEAIYLIGYTSVKYFGEEADSVIKLWDEYRNEIEKAGCYYIEGATARIYLPLKNAIVYINGKKYVGDNEGKVFLDEGKTVESIKLAGRAKTEKSVYTKFRSKIKPSSSIRERNAYFFNLGYRRMSCCHSERTSGKRSLSESSSGDISCVENHLPYRNCTEAFPQYAQGRCETRYDRCMDYNGWGTDCSGSRLYFLNSDCGVAVYNGECWNEIGMRGE
ncbi:MAG: hypothetical protein IJ154_05310 [Bacteroidales bacterium]|nr:hypothetical protein [Bacteroidales bacterium]